MRVLLINNCHYRRGGADVVYLNTGDLLERKGHDVFYFAQLSDKNIKCESEKYFIKEVDLFNKSLTYRISLLFRFFYSFEAAKKIKKLILDKKPEIAHIHYYKGAITPSVLKVLKKHKVPVVQTLHDYGLICPHNLFLDGKGKICTRCFDTGNTLNCIIHRCNRNNLLLSLLSFLEYTFQSIFVPSRKYINHFIIVCDFSLNLHNKKIQYRNKLHRLYNFNPDINTIMQSPISNDYFLFFGRVSFEKGIITLLGAWAEAKISKRLIIVGDGPQMDEIHKVIKERNLQNIECLGFMDKKELVEIIKNAYFVIIPSEVNENNPLSIIESYKYGKPVIASAVGGIPEIVTDAETGFLFKMGDTTDLKKQLERADNLSEDKYRSLSFGARAFAINNFSEEVHYKSLITIYNQVIKDAGNS